MTQFLTLTESTLIYALAQGKPDSRHPLLKGEADLRPRIAQAPQKGTTCTYYVFAMLRQRYGPHSVDFPAERRVEKICSEFRKDVTALNITQIKSDFKILKNLMEDLGLDPELEEMKVSSAVLLKSLTIDRIATVVNAFISQTEYDDLYEYYTHLVLEPLRRVHFKFFDALSVDPEKIYLEDARLLVAAKLTENLENFPPDFLKESIESIDTPRPSWPEYLQTRPNILNAYALKVMAEAYGFSISTWTPYQSIAFLKACLEKNRALIVGGKFAKKHFIQPPIVKQILEGRFIYGWNQERKICSPLFLTTGTRTSHAVVVIGASLEAGGFVYHVDPNDGSDPSNPDQQKIYSLSYASFIERINDLRNVPAISRKEESPFGYALYHPKDVAL